MKINPVLLKELKVRMRGWKAAGIIALYLLALTAVAVFIIYTVFTDPYTSSIDPQVSIGAYTGLAVIQFILIMFIVPALTAGAISGEREKQTLDLVLCTRLRPISIITGKLFASTAFLHDVSFWGNISKGNNAAFRLLYCDSSDHRLYRNIFLHTFKKNNSINGSYIWYLGIFSIWHHIHRIILY